MFVLKSSKLLAVTQECPKKQTHLIPRLCSGLVQGTLTLTLPLSLSGVVQGTLKVQFTLKELAGLMLISSQVRVPSTL